ncbi:Protein NLP4 [Bienertia sinuspersici]
MDDAVFHSSVTLGATSSSPMELDYMDQLLLEGCWLEAFDGSNVNFFHQSPSTSGALFDSSYLWPMLEVTNERSSINPTQKNGHQVRETSELAENSAQADNNNNNAQQVGPLVNLANGQSIPNIGAESNQFHKFCEEGSELNKVLWIKPMANTVASTVMERLFKALSYIKDSEMGKDLLVQIWVPVARGSTRILTTVDQPFSVNSSCSQLASYRDISVNYEFAAEEGSCVSVGLPGRVFLGKVPEWTPDVRFFRVDEYPRVTYAQQCDVRGTLALPVFEQGSRNCLGVLEVVMTTQKVNYRPELENVCRALQAVDLRSCSEIPGPQKAMDYCCSSYQAALPEILEVIKSACSSHQLPLAQTWVPCIQQGKEGRRHSDENLSHCVSTVDSACFIANPSMQDFHEACSEHHLLKGQGVVGKAFMTNQPCFSADITTYSKTEYPLSHHARMFQLCSAVAIRLRCIYTGNADFVLEFFLPVDCTDPEVQKQMLTSLSIIIQRVCRSLRVVSEEEIEQETSMLNNNNVTVISDDLLHRQKMLKVENTLSGSSQEESCGIPVQERERNGSLPKPQEDQPREVSPRSSSLDYSVAGDGSFSTAGKAGEKKRAKAEKTITLDVLRQHFAGSLKDAAKNIGVCPTTLKRICRQHGIKRWPSRKIKKVGHSLQKLQVVIDSVQGASGALQIGSFYSNFPDLASPNFSNTSPFSTAKQEDLPQQTNKELEGTATSNSPSESCSQSSSSSQCCSSGTQQQQFTWNAPRNEDPQGGMNSNDGALKRARSDAELLIPSHQTTNHISRSQSQKSLVEQLNSPDLRPPMEKNSGPMISDVDSWRVKVAYGEEKIRFRILRSWGFNDLAQEVVKRFHIGDMSGYQLKYLDDDSEWVLLTCDDDLQECLDICRSSQRQTIKLSLQVSNSYSRSSVASNSHL